MIPIFDLDDTLYDELTYVHSGFRAVAKWASDTLGIDEHSSIEKLVTLLEREGRGRIFNTWLDGRGSVRDALRVYRHHVPAIELFDSARTVLGLLSPRALYLVTDGHKVVQGRKVEALGIRSLFRHTYLTHRYGIASAKPSTRCFSLIRQRECCEWDQMIYVGDNPAKDFVNLNPLGVHTIRVLTGQHRLAVARPGFDARHTIESLDQLPELLTSCGIDPMLPAAPAPIERMTNK